MNLHFATFVLCAAAVAANSQTPGPLQPRPADALRADEYQVAAGTHILLQMTNSVSTNIAQPGDRLYLKTAFPVIVNGVIVIPEGSYVMGTITAVTPPKRRKHPGQMQVRFDSLTLPNGVSRSFRSDLGAIDPTQGEKLNREKSTVQSTGDKGKDAEVIVGGTTAGTVIGSGIGAAAGHAGMGAGLGAAAGLGSTLAAVMFSRGPDAFLRQGSTVEMVLDHPLTFQASEVGHGAR